MDARPAKDHAGTQGWRGSCQVAMPAKNMPGRKAGEDHARSQCPEKHPWTQGWLRQEASQVNRQRSAVLRTTVASVTLHVIKAKANKTFLPVREKWDRHKEPVSPYFRFS